MHFGKTTKWRFDDPSREFGVLYISRHNPKLVCAAIFDRAPAWRIKKLGSFLGRDLVSRTAELLDTYRVGLV